MDEVQEKLWLEGNRAAYRSLLGECLRQLGYDSPEADKAAFIREREDIIAQLRDLCRAFGDNDWPEDMHLGDVIEKHLGKYLHAE